MSPNVAPKCTKTGCLDSLEQVPDNTNYLRLVLEKSELKTDPVLLICDSGEATMNKHLALSAEFIGKTCSNFVGEISGVED